VSAPPAAAGLRVELVFGAGADLDLYVTDPSQETVYYANTPSRLHAGRLAVDRACDALAPRIETIAFESAPSGRYRVGVDYAASCGRDGSPREPFLVIVEGNGARRELRGEAPRGRFLVRVLEFGLGPGAGFEVFESDAPKAKRPGP